MSDFRSIKNLHFVEVLEEEPAGPWTNQRLRGANKRGVQYEKVVDREIKHNVPDDWEYLPHQWFRFRDDKGISLCQTDFYLIPPETERPIILLECKLTQTDFAFRQMREKYVPILEHVYKRPVQQVLVCKQLRKRIKTGRIDLFSDLLVSRGTQPLTWWNPGI